MTPITGAQRYTDGDDLAFVCKTATMPSSGERRAVDDHSALSVRHIGVVVSLEPLAGRPVIAAESLPPATFEPALEAVNRSTVLEPLDNSSPLLQPSKAGARPCRGILGVGMPIPKSAACLRIEKPASILARRGPVDLQ